MFLKQHRDSSIDPTSTSKTTKPQIVTFLCLIILHTIFWWLFELYSNELYAFLVISIFVTLGIDFSEYLIPNKPKTYRAIWGGAFHAVFLVMLPKYALLAVCLNFVGFWTTVQVLNTPWEVSCLIVSNFIGWAGCYFYYQYWFPAIGYPDDVKYIKTYFGDSFYYYQLLLAIVLGYWMSRVALIAKGNENKARMIYEQNLLTLNKNLEETNQKLFKANKELQEALSEKENFILRFSHEIRNPLNSLLGNVDLCQEYAEDEQSRQMLSEAKVSGEILLQLLNNILDTAKVSANRLDLSMLYQDIRSFLERAWVVCSEIIRRKKLYGCLSVNINVPEIVEFDSHRLMQILINTVSNASKFTDHGYVKVFVDFEEGPEICPEDMKPKHADSYGQIEDCRNRTEQLIMLNQDEFLEYPEQRYESLSTGKKKFTEDRDFHVKRTREDSIHTPRKPDIMLKERGFTPDRANEGPKDGYLRLEIVDTGCGIKKNDLEMLFTKFSQVSDESSKRQIGTGLGLWITKEIVELMKGKIEVFSVPNHGTVLVMMLKCKSGQQLPRAQNHSQANAQIPMCALIKRALVVEDIPYNQEINCKFLRKCGVEEIFEASNGAEALALYTEKGREYFDLILMDIDMPVMDGKIATMLIRLHEANNEWRPTPVVFLTAFSEAKMQKELLDPNGVYKADRFLSKPTSQDIIKRTLVEIAEKLQQRKRKLQHNATHNLRGQPNDLGFGVDKLVLLIDDDPSNLSILSKMLVKCGYRALEASNAKEALELYDENCRNVNLVLTDCEMPGMNGIGVTKEIIARHRRAQLDQSLVIYGITGNVVPEHKLECLKAGMRDVLEKPITFDTLRTLILRSNNIFHDIIRY